MDKSEPSSSKIIGRRILPVRLTLLFTVLLGTVAATAWTKKETCLRVMATLWIVSDQILPANAAIVLGGGVEMRPFIAAQLYSQGLVTKILISNVEDGSVVRIGVSPGHTDLN